MHIFLLLRYGRSPLCSHSWSPPALRLLPLFFFCPPSVNLSSTSVAWCKFHCGKSHWPAIKITQGGQMWGWGWGAAHTPMPPPKQLFILFFLFFFFCIFFLLLTCLTMKVLFSFLFNYLTMFLFEKRKKRRDDETMSRCAGCACKDKWVLYTNVLRIWERYIPLCPAIITHYIILFCTVLYCTLTISKKLNKLK